MSSFGHKMRELFEDVPQAIDFFADGNHAQKHAVDYFCHWLIWQSLNEQMPEIFDELSSDCENVKFNRGAEYDEMMRQRLHHAIREAQQALESLSEQERKSWEGV